MAIADQASVMHRFRAIAIAIEQEPMDRTVKNDKFYYAPLLLGKEFIPGAVYDRLKINHHHHRAVHRVLVLACLLYADRLEGKLYPKRLPRLVVNGNPIWRDPYSGKPFLMKRQRGFLRIYSLGEDGTDDGGPICILDPQHDLHVSTDLDEEDTEINVIAVHKSWNHRWEASFILPILKGDEGYDPETARLYGWVK